MSKEGCLELFFKSDDTKHNGWVHLDDFYRIASKEEIDFYEQVGFFFPESETAR